MQEKTTTFTYAIIVLCTFFTLVAAFVVAYVIYINKRKTRFINEQEALKQEFLHQLLQSRVEVQETTFQHIAKELHDNIGQLLSYTKMLLGTTWLQLPEPPDSLKVATDTLAKAIGEIRSLSRSLDKDWLAQFDFKNNLKDEIGRIQAGGAIQASGTCNAFIDMPPAQQLILFRIVQEAIQNSIKHAAPARIDVQVWENGKTLCLSVIDDGLGIKENFHGMGTSNMQQRTRLFGGTIRWDRQEGAGTAVHIVIPV